MFEKASRMKLRFETALGALSVEDLWDLPLLSDKRRNGVCLDGLAQALSRELKESDVESFVLKQPAAESAPRRRLQLAFDVVKRVIDVRLAEQTAAENVEKRRQEKQKILEIIARKEDANLEGKSLEELKTILAGL